MLDPVAGCGYGSSLVEVREASLQEIDRQPDITSPPGSLAPSPDALEAWRQATSRSLSSAERRLARTRIAGRFAGPYDVSVEGVLLRTYPLENHCDRIVLGRGKLPESDERRLIAPLLRPDMVFVDIGANVGVYSLFVSVRTAGRARIVAFEPNPRTFAKLVCNCELNGFGHVDCVNAAVGPADSEGALFLESTSNAGSATMIGDNGAATAAVAIRIVALADMLQQRRIAAVDLLKIDVEGFEDGAMLPFFRTAPRSLWPAHMLLETVHAQRWREDLLGFLLGNGYREAGRTSENILLAT